MLGMRVPAVVRLVTATQVFLLLAMLLLPGLAAAATIQTDLFVYADGDTVTVTGVEFGANEVVDFVTTDPNGSVVDTGSATSDDAGNVNYAFTLHATVDGVYDVLGTGETSQLSAATQFDPHTVKITSAAVGAKRTVAGGFDVPVTINVVCSGTSGAGACSAISSISLVTAGDTLSTPTGFAVPAVPTPAGGTDVTVTFHFRTSPGPGQFAIPADGTYAMTASMSYTGGGTSPATDNVAGYLIVDNSAPAAPAITSVTGSPANNNNPVVGGSAEAGSTINLYGNSACTGSTFGSGTVAGGGTFSVTATVPNDSTTDFYGTATDAAGNVSTCSTTHKTYVEDSTVLPPVLVSSTPPSPNQNTAPLINGTAEAGSTVSLYKSSACTGTHDDGIAAGGAFSIAVSVGNNSTTSFWGKATDLAGNVSSCSSTSVTYNADNNGPSVTLNSTPTNPTTSTTAGFTFTANDAGANASGVASVQCRLDSPTWGPCNTDSSFTATVGTGAHTFAVRATDSAGNVGTETAFSWTVNAADAAPTVVSTSPANAATAVALDAGISTTFSEPVTVSSISVVCATSGSHTYSATGNGTSTVNFALGVADSYAFGETCTVTIGKSSVSDVDLVDPPDNMAADYVFTFSTVADTTAPIISYTAKNADNSTYTPGTWTNQSVTVAFTCADNSGLLSVNTVAADGGTQNGDTAAGSFTALGSHCVDAAGNSATTVAVSPIQVDKTPPVITYTAAESSPNANNWFNADVTADFSVNAGVSGPDAACAAAFPGGVQAKTTTGEGAAITVTSDDCTDLAGNHAAGVSSAAYQIDKSKPVITGSRTPAANGFGWNNTDVVVSFSCADQVGLSGVDSDTVAGTTISAEGANQSFTNTGSCTDKAGNTADSATVTGINIDKTPPVVTLVGGGLADWGVYYYGFVPAGPTGCTADTAISGPDGACTVSGYSTAIGAQVVTGSATDKAGNTGTSSLHYSVNRWTLTGFYQPVSMTTLNTVKGGSTVPLKFNVYAGPTELKLTSYVASFTVTKVTCANLADMLPDPVDFTTTGGTSLRYDGTAGQFIQNWQTPKTPNVCYGVTMTTQDGSKLEAFFQTK
jgi:Bacterial Ig-like domain/Bacterial Ig domain